MNAEFATMWVWNGVILELGTPNGLILPQAKRNDEDWKGVTEKRTNRYGGPTER